MKNSLKIASAILGLGLVLGGCNKDNSGPKLGSNAAGEPAAIRITLPESVGPDAASPADAVRDGSRGQKTSDIKDVEEQTITSLDVFVFRAGGALDVPEIHTTESKDIIKFKDPKGYSIDITSGRRDVYVLANVTKEQIGDLGAVQTEGDFKALKVKMLKSDNSAFEQKNTLSMFGKHTNVDVKAGDKDMNVPVNLIRHAARVTVAWNTDANTDKTTLSNGDSFTVTNVYAVYAQPDAFADSTNNAPATLNADEYLYGSFNDLTGLNTVFSKDFSTLSPLLSKNYYRYDIKPGEHKGMSGTKSKSGESYFYLFPNKIDGNKSTRVVIEAQFTRNGASTSETTYYFADVNPSDTNYNGTLTNATKDGIKSNNIYNIYANITGIGVKNPLQAPDEKANITVTITVNPWKTTWQTVHF